ncbi:MAG: hypothetical protein K5889_05880 [Lachnospiraceae bacterium]|nr:hypothetical protein [Lachnospiraceae bacterium]
MKKKKAFVVFCFILGLILIAGGAYFPSFLYSIIYSFDEHFYDIRFANVIPGFRMAGVVLTAWGIAIYLKKDNE